MSLNMPIRPQKLYVSKHTSKPHMSLKVPIRPRKLFVSKHTSKPHNLFKNLTIKKKQINRKDGVIHINKWNIGAKDNFI